MLPQISESVHDAPADAVNMSVAVHPFNECYKLYEELKRWITDGEKSTGGKVFGVGFSFYSPTHFYLVPLLPRGVFILNDTAQLEKVFFLGKKCIKNVLEKLETLKGKNNYLLGKHFSFYGQLFPLFLIEVYLLVYQATALESDDAT